MGFLKAPKSDSKEDVAAFRLMFCENYLLGSRPLTSHKQHEIVCEEAYSRGIERRGIPRQLAAIKRQVCRDERLKTMTQFPTCILAGEVDKLVPIANAHHLHSLIPNSELEIFPEMGHYPDPTHTLDYYGAFVKFMKRTSARKSSLQPTAIIKLNHLPCLMFVCFVYSPFVYLLATTATHIHPCRKPLSR